MVAAQGFVVAGPFCMRDVVGEREVRGSVPGYACANTGGETWYIAQVKMLLLEGMEKTLALRSVVVVSPRRVGGIKITKKNKPVATGPLPYCL